jgi:type IV secretion system protein VirD4
MTLRANTALWQPPAKGSKVPFALTVLSCVIVGLIGALYLASIVFLLLIKADPRAASPMTLVRYGYYYGGRDDVRQRLAFSSAVGLALVLAPGIVLLLPKRRSLHGDARFASRREIARAGLLGDHGIILGRLGSRCLMLPGQQGVCLAAPPRAGKGTGVVIPNALNWPGSLVCVDIKKENWTITAGFRRHRGQSVFLFDPFAEDGATARWNPLGYVSEEEGLRVNGLQRIADMFYPEAPGVDPFWIASARTLFLGVALYVFETPSLPKTIGEILRQGMASSDEGFAQHWKRLIEGRNAGKFPLSQGCVRALCDVIDLAPVTASSIRKTFTSRLDLWLNPILDAATSANDFDLRELRSRTMSIYVGVNPDDLHRLRPVLALFFQQAIGLQTRALPEHDPKLKYQVLMLLDECAALGRIPILAEALSYLPGYNVRVALVIHTPAQLREIYGVNAAETMLKSLAARIVFAAKDFGDAKEISDELGTTTVRVKSHSRPVAGLLDARGQKSRSVSVSEQRRPLLLPQEVQALEVDDAIIFYEGLRPIRCKKIRYFADYRFRKRLLEPPRHASTRRPKPTPITPPSLEVSGTLSTLEPSPEAVSTVERVLPQGDAGAGDYRTREATPQDIERIDELTLEDFAVDFGRVVLPDKADGERMTTAEMDTAVEGFLAALREGPDGRGGR